MMMDYPGGNTTTCDRSDENSTKVNDGFASTDDIECFAHSTPFLVILLEYIQLYYMPVLMILGCFGNSLSIFVFFGTKLKKLSSSYYLSALAISDCGFLIAQFITWLNLINIPLFNEPGFCQMSIYISHLCSFISVWLVVLFTIERFIAVRYPLHRTAVCTVSRAKLFIGCLTIIAMVAYSPYFIVAAPQNITEIYDNKTSTIQMCTLVTEHMALATILNHADFFLTLVLPFILIASLNSLICRTVSKLSSVRHVMTQASRKRVLNRRRQFLQQSKKNLTNRRSSLTSQAKVTHMLLVVSSVFLMLNLPSYTFRIYVYINEKSNVTDKEDNLLAILQHYANVLFATNFGINFILYCISGQNFRKSLCSLFYRPKRQQNGKEQITQSTAIPELSRSCINTSSVMRKSRRGRLNSSCSSFIEMQIMTQNSNIATDHTDTRSYV